MSRSPRGLRQQDVQAPGLACGQGSLFSVHPHIYRLTASHWASTRMPSTGLGLRMGLLILGEERHSSKVPQRRVGLTQPCSRAKAPGLGHLSPAGPGSAPASLGSLSDPTLGAPRPAVSGSGEVTPILLASLLELSSGLEKAAALASSSAREAPGCSARAHAGRPRAALPSPRVSREQPLSLWGPQALLPQARVTLGIAQQIR